MGKWKSYQDQNKTIMRDIPGTLSIVLFSLLTSLSVNSLSPQGIPLKGQLYKTQGEVITRGKDQNILPELEIKNPIKIKQIIDHSSMIVIDVRPKFIYDEGHIPGALSYPLANLDNNLEKFCNQFDKSSPLLLYCSGALCTDSHTAASKLISLGFSKIKVFPGGFKEWQEIGFPTENSEE